MRQRIALGSVAAAAMVGFVLLWTGMGGEPAAAMERMAENLRQAKSYTALMKMEMSLSGGPGKPPVAAEVSQKTYWQTPDCYRTEFKGGRHAGLLDQTQIFPAGKPGIMLDHKAKVFLRLPARLGNAPPMMIMDKLGQFSGQADRKLGEKEIDGKKAWGFEIDAAKIDPSAPAGPVEIWLDAKSNLPVAISYQTQWAGMAAPIRTTMSDFQWNIDLDPKLFDPTPPAGYADATPKPVPIDQQIHTIADALRIYAEASGGHYPRVKVVYGDVTRDELIKLLGVPWPPRTLEQARDERIAKVHKATNGFAAITVLQRNNPDAAYYGKTVRPKDKDQVLLRWKLDDGRYAVLFGDLHSETVTAERLRALEGQAGKK